VENLDVTLKDVAIQGEKATCTAAFAPKKEPTAIFTYAYELEKRDGKWAVSRSSSVGAVHGDGASPVRNARRLPPMDGSAPPVADPAMPPGHPPVTPAPGSAEGKAMPSQPPAQPEKAQERRRARPSGDFGVPPPSLRLDAFRTSPYIWSLGGIGNVLQGMRSRFAAGPHHRKAHPPPQIRGLREGPADLDRKYEANAIALEMEKIRVRGP